ncbi:MAG: glycerol-3-phosphate responsive antiterminator [Clostridiales bacterium]|nr:glycerol-3-phosphate responsive antiterminator [Clostridiales bacterium]
MIEFNPVIMSVKDWEGVERCLTMDSKVVFILFGNICNISEIVKKIRDAGKIAIVHIDLIAGLSSREVAVDFMKQLTDLDGIISTRPALIRRARELGLFTILRFFLLDSLALQNLKKQESVVQPDMIEILPGVMPKVTKRLTEGLKTPVICGGLIADRDDVMNAIQAGAVAISSTNADVWEL